MAIRDAADHQDELIKNCLGLRGQIHQYVGKRGLSRSRACDRGPRLAAKRLENSVNVLITFSTERRRNDRFWELAFRAVFTHADDCASRNLRCTRFPGNGAGLAAAAYLLASGAPCLPNVKPTQWRLHRLLSQARFAWKRNPQSTREFQARQTWPPSMACTAQRSTAKHWQLPGGAHHAVAVHMSS